MLKKKIKYIYIICKLNKFIIILYVKLKKFKNFFNLIYIYTGTVRFELTTLLEFLFSR